MSTDHARRKLFKVAAAGALAATPVAAQAQFWRRGDDKASAPVPANEQERTALRVLEDIDKNQRHLNVGAEDGRLLRVLTESIGAKQVVEIGTSPAIHVWLLFGIRSARLRLHLAKPGPARLQLHLAKPRPATSPWSGAGRTP